MTECTGQQVLFSIGKKRVTTVFDGGNLTSDSGVLFLNRIDERLGLSRRMAEVLSDRRQEGKVQHCLRDLLRQRLFQIGLGYARTPTTPIRCDLIRPSKRPWTGFLDRARLWLRSRPFRGWKRTSAGAI